MNANQSKLGTAAKVAARDRLYQTRLQSCRAECGRDQGFQSLRLFLSTNLIKNWTGAHIRPTGVGCGEACKPRVFFNGVIG